MKSQLGFLVLSLLWSFVLFIDSFPKAWCDPLQKNLPSNSVAKNASARIVQTEENIGQIEPVFEEDSRPYLGPLCGSHTIGLRIFGGNATKLDEFPWMALLGYMNRTNFLNYKCGGALINRRYVLTAAHCIIGSIVKIYGKLVTVRLGEYDTRNAVDCVDNACANPHQEIPVHVAYPHKGYKDKTKNKKDDIGLLRLAVRAIYSYYVKPICLADRGQHLDVGTEAYVAGWGKTLEGPQSPLKLKIRLPIYSKDDCFRIYRKQGYIMTENMLCAGGLHAKDTCLGDSGGPLMKINPNRSSWQAVGVVSFGRGCGIKSWPGVYSSVASYLDWINFTLKVSNI